MLATFVFQLSSRNQVSPNSINVDPRPPYNFDQRWSTLINVDQSWSKLIKVDQSYITNTNLPNKQKNNLRPATIKVDQSWSKLKAQTFKNVIF